MKKNMIKIICIFFITSMATSLMTSCYSSRELGRDNGRHHKKYDKHHNAPVIHIEADEHSHH